MHFASTHQNLDVMNLLLLHGADLNAQRITGKTPLFSVYSDTAATLILWGADTSVTDLTGATAIDCCDPVVKRMLREVGLCLQVFME